MSKFVIYFEIPSRPVYGITCQSEPLPQWELADFIQSITEAEYHLLKVETVEEVEPEAVYAPEELDEEQEPDVYEEEIMEDEE